MFQKSGLSLRCINYNNRLIAAYNDGLILEPPIKPIKKNALWTVTHKPSSWSLINQVSSTYLTFDTKNKSKSKEPLKVRDGNRHLILRLSLNGSASVTNRLCFELLVAENNFNGETSAVFFVCEVSNQIFRDITLDFFSNPPTRSMNIIENSVDNYYDYVVIGSSFCCLAFIYRILENDPKAKILVLEKGLKYLPEHHQHCPPSSSPTEVEFRPWSISCETLQNGFIKNVHGQIALVGGRSTYWSGWSPTPSAKELAEWPESLKTPLQEKYFGLAREFLGVTTANCIKARENNKLVYNTFQSYLKNCLDSASNIESVEQVLHAPLAMDKDRSIKFSTPKMLLSMENVTIIVDCTVEKILHDGTKATALQTSHGTILPLNKSKLILAMSTLPSTTLVLNSFTHKEFPQLSNVGKRFTAHFVSSVIARVPRQSQALADSDSTAELAALYIAGMQEKAQYHVQLSGVAYTKCENNNNIYDICKKYSGNSIPKECLDVSQDFVVVSSSTLGELDYKNKCNKFNLTNDSHGLTTNGELNVQINDQDERLWDLMDRVTFKVLNTLSSATNTNDLEYWHETDKTWKNITPSSEQIRKKFLVHDASTMWIGNNEDTEASVGLDYRLRGVDNVYITGGALWPTGGSWNPVVTIVAMAIHLADTLYLPLTTGSTNIR